MPLDLPGNYAGEPAHAWSSRRGSSAIATSTPHRPDFVLSDDEMRQISLMGNAKIRFTDFGFAPKWD